MALCAGRVFGYVNSRLTTAVRKSHRYDPKPDAEIAFTHRFPTPSLFAGAPKYGWPSKGETMGYEIALTNNGQTAIPAGAAKLRVWLNTPIRNADTVVSGPRKSDFVISIKEALPPFDPMHPEYLRYRVTTKWPYDLIPCGPEAEFAGEGSVPCELRGKGVARRRGIPSAGHERHRPVQCQGRDRASR